MQPTLRIKPIYLIAFLLLLSGCKLPITVNVQVDSLARADSQSKNSYILLPGNKDVNPEDLQFQEYALYIERALADRGFRRANTFAEADIAIFLTYGIGDPKTNRHSYSMPIWKQTNVFIPPVTDNTYDHSDNTLCPQYKAYTPTHVIAGSTSHTVNYTTYSRYLFIDAVDIATYKQNKKMIRLWETNAFSTGSSGDLHMVLPYMVAAMKPYLGSNTGQAIDVKIPEKDPFIKQIKGLAPKK